MKIARPRARAMTRGGMVRRTRGFLTGLVEGEGGGLVVVALPVEGRGVGLAVGGKVSL